MTEMVEAGIKLMWLDKGMLRCGHDHDSILRTVTKSV